MPYRRPYRVNGTDSTVGLPGYLCTLAAPLLLYRGTRRAVRYGSPYLVLVLKPRPGLASDCVAVRYPWFSPTSLALVPARPSDSGPSVMDRRCTGSVVLLAFDWFLMGMSRCVGDPEFTRHLKLGSSINTKPGACLVCDVRETPFGEDSV